MELLISLLIFLVVLAVVAYVYNQYIAPAIPDNRLRLLITAILAIIALYYLLSRILHVV